jgi:hypothetical protein
LHLPPSTGGTLSCVLIVPLILPHCHPPRSKHRPQGGLTPHSSFESVSSPRPNQNTHPVNMASLRVNMLAPNRSVPQTTVQNSAEAQRDSLASRGNFGCFYITSDKTSMLGGIFFFSPSVGCFGTRSDDVNNALYPLRSVIIAPSIPDKAPRIYHPSFRDFITDPSRCCIAEFLGVAVDHEVRHALLCFELMEIFLKHDMAGISDFSLLNSEVEELEEKVTDVPVQPTRRILTRIRHLSWMKQHTRGNKGKVRTRR